MASLRNGNRPYFYSDYFDCRGAFQTVFDFVLLCNGLSTADSEA